MTRLTLRTLELELTRPFRIARGTTETLEALIVRIDHAGHTGWGQAVASPAVTGETLGDARTALEALDPADLDPDDPAGTLANLEDLGPGARAGIDLALHDLDGRRTGTPAHRRLDLPDGEAPCAATVTLTDPDDAAEQARTWLGRGFTRLKIKVGDPSAVLDLVDAVDAALPDTVRDPMPDPEIWIDANEALTLEDARSLLPALAERSVALVEQPLPREERDALAELAAESPLPIVLDEAIDSVEDVHALASLDGPLGINVKVQKVGGLLAAHRLVRAAKGHGLDVMVGCNIETGLGIAAGACLVGAADHADLDGNLFLSQDPFPLPRPMPGHVGTTEAPGLGVNPDPRWLPKPS